MSQVCLITGSTKGLGKIIAKIFLKDGYRVILNYSSDDEAARGTLKELEVEFPNSEIMICKADVGSEEDVSRMVNEIITKYSSIDVLVYNAGINRDAVSWKMKKEDWDKVINTNLTGAFLCTKHVLQHMREKMKGSIVYISSITGKTGVFGASNYTASKAGIFGLSKSIAKEVANKNITVNTIACGYTTTGMGSRLPEEVVKEVLKKIPLGRFGTPEEVADLVLFLTKASYITGQIICIDGGLT